MIEVYDYQLSDSDKCITSLNVFVQTYVNKLSEGEVVGCFVFDTDEQIKILKYEDEFVVSSDKDYSMVRQLVVTKCRLNRRVCGNV